MKYIKMILVPFLMVTSAYANHVMVGSYTDIKTNQNELFSFTSSNLGNTWHRSVSAPSSTNGDNSIYATTCVAQEKHCVTVGNVDKGSDFLPLAYYSDDGGETWKLATVKSSRGHFTYLKSVACNENGQHCVAVGNSMQNNLQAISYYSEDGGHNWEISNDLPKPATQEYESALESVACDWTGMKCVAVGAYQNRHGVDLALAYTSSNGGKDWELSQQPPNQNDNRQVLQGVACDAGAQHCVAVGGFWEQEFVNSPLVYTTNDGGNSWQASSIPPLNKEANMLLKVDCDNSGIVCTAVGNTVVDGETAAPLIYRTANGGKNWTPAEQISTADSFYSLRDVSCNSEGKECLAVGVKFNQNKSTVVSFSNTDGSKRWLPTTQSPEIKSETIGLEVSLG